MTNPPKHWDACHAIIFIEMVEEGREIEWVNEALGSRGFGPYDLTETRQWLAETGGKCRCDHCCAKPALAHKSAQLSLFG